MDIAEPGRHSWVCCPSCGNKVGKVRTCDMEVKCGCGYLYIAIIGSAQNYPKADRRPADAVKQ